MRLSSSLTRSYVCICIPRRKQRRVTSTWLGFICINFSTQTLCDMGMSLMTWTPDWIELDRIRTGWCMQHTCTHTCITMVIWYVVWHEVNKPDEREIHWMIKKKDKILMASWLLTSIIHQHIIYCTHWWEKFHGNEILSGLCFWKPNVKSEGIDCNLDGMSLSYDRVGI